MRFLKPLVIFLYTVIETFMETIPPRKTAGTIDALFIADGDTFTSRETASLVLTFEGIIGDYHHGATRLSGGREPWYKRGTEIRNERQLSLLSKVELDVVAQRLNIPEIKPEWIGCNVLLGGVENLSFMPPRTNLMFKGGATIRIDGNNGPCKVSGRAIAEHHEGRDDITTGFSREAQHIRGLVGWVEKPGVIHKGEGFVARLPEQWIYQG